jgi:hypothetical protein
VVDVRGQAGERPAPGSTGTALPIASDPASLTPTWLTEALRAGGALDATAAVATVSCTPVGTGQVSDSVRLELTYDGPTPGPASLVAKLPAADPTSRATGLAMRNYEREVRFYQSLASELPVRTPHCLHADIDVATGDFVLLLEDLSPARQGDQLTGCAVDVAAIAIGELPKLHGPRWGDPGLTTIDWLHGDPDAGRAVLSELVPTLHVGFRERYAAVLHPDAALALDALIPRLDRYLTPVPGAPTTVVHGDYRLDNLLFGGPEGGAPVAVVDWQTVAHGAALSDVAYFLGAGLQVEDRRTHEVALVRAYHDQLRTFGVDGFSWDDCWLAYRRGTWAGLFMAVVASMIVERTDRGDEMFLAMAERHARHVLDLDAVALLG